MNVRFMLLSEGSSERGLLRHLEALCVRAGAAEAYGEWPDLGRLHAKGKSVAEQLQAALREYGHANLAFVHRDSDA